MRRALPAFLVVAAVLLGVLAAGSPVHGEPTVAKRTAGIELGSRASSAPRAEATSSTVRIPQHLLLLLLALGLLGFAARVEGTPVRALARSVVRSQGSARRGPPALA